jgi:predicted O-methyltransferase YrrM
MSPKVRAALDAALAAGMHQNLGEITRFAEWLAQHGGIRNVVEIGTLKGGTATLWHELCDGVIISVDLPGGRWGGADHNLFTEQAWHRNTMLQSRLERFRGVLGDSRSPVTVNAVRHALNGPNWGNAPDPVRNEQLIDLLFIDGDHSFDGVAADYVNYSWLVRPGGVIAFHDVLDTPIHRRDGVDVKRFWDALPGSKFVFSDAGAWGGIGVLIKC